MSSTTSPTSASRCCAGCWLAPPPRGRWANSNPVGHHVTNVVLTETADGSVHAQSKGIGINADGTCGSVTYEDTVVHGDQGWRISQRKIQARKAPPRRKAEKDLIPAADVRAFAERVRAVSGHPVSYAELPGAHHDFDL